MNNAYDDYICTCWVPDFVSLAYWNSGRYVTSDNQGVVSLTQRVYYPDYSLLVYSVICSVHYQYRQPDLFDTILVF